MFKPMLATSRLDGLHFPVLISPKLDGIRATVQRGDDGELHLYSRSGKLIPNRYIQAKFTIPRYENCDGELYITGKTFSEVQSAVMSVEGIPENVRYVKFDYFHPFWNAGERYNHLKSLGGDCVPSTQIEDIISLMKHHLILVSIGYEGTMVLDPRGYYIQGQASKNAQQLVKIKDYVDAEATVTGSVERKNHPNTLGSILADFNGVEIVIGTGFTEQQRCDMWQTDMIGKEVKFKYQTLYPTGKPRFPVYLGLRAKGT